MTERKSYHRKGLGVDAKILIALLKHQPIPKNKLFLKARVNRTSVPRVIQILIQQGIVKETEKGYALFNYVELEKDIEDLLNESLREGSLPITISEIASEIGVSPSEIEKVIFPIAHKLGLVVGVDQNGERTVGKKVNGILLV